MENADLTKLISLRKDLHKFPEVSGNEKVTAQKMVEFLKKYSPHEIIENLGGHGVAAVYDFNIPGATIMIRCELDALPIQEINRFEHRSINACVSHKCGHDGHMVMVAALAKKLSENKNRKGKVVLLFQPAEENGDGAVAVIPDEKFKSIVPDYIFALHNLPGFALNQIVCKAGSFNAAVTSLIIYLDGKTSHAAEPEKGLNPALAIAEIIVESQKFNVAQNHDDFALITPIQLEMGEEAYGISAGHGIVRLTLRCWDNVTMEKLKSNVINSVKSLAKKYNLNLKTEWIQTFASCQNDSSMKDLIKEISTKNKFEFLEKERPFKWGEDFGLFTERYKGAMFGLGSGEKCPALHNPDYDFPDEIIPTGVKMFSDLIDHFTL